MDALDLAWDTFDFHSIEIAKLEQLHLDNINDIRSLLKEEIDPPYSKRIKIKKNALKCCDQIIVSYKKQISSIEDVLKINNSGIDIPQERYVENEFLNELKLLTATLMYEMVTYKEEINKLLS
jgi:hypothetical protein